MKIYLAVMQPLSALLFTLCFGMSFVVYPQEPSVPPGFSSLELKEIQATIFKPDGWHVTHLKRKTPDAALGYQITLEDSEKLGGFKTGLTINVFDKVDEHHSVKPTVFAAELIKRYAAKGEVETFKDGIEAGPLKVARLRLRRTMTLLGQETETMLVFTTMANDNTGTCYIFIFGTPVSEWPEQEKVLAQMSKVNLDDER